MAIGIPLIQRILDDFKNGDARQLKLFLQNLYEKVKGIEENVNVKINNVPSLEPTKNTLALRDSDGQMKAQDPTEDDDVVTKGWADSEYAPGTAGDIESAQDAVGSILVDSASVDFTYNDATPSITAAVLPAGVDHAALSNLNSASYTHLTAANHTDLTDAGDTTLHFHSADRARANHTGTQTAATISDFSTAVETVGDPRYVNVTGDTMTGELGVIAGSATTPGLFISGNSNTGLYSPGTGLLNVTLNGVNRWDFGPTYAGASFNEPSSGGTIYAYNSNSGSSAFASVQAISDSATFRFGANSAAYTPLGAYKADGVFVDATGNASGGMSIITQHASAPIRFYTGGYADANERFNIASNGNITSYGPVSINNAGGTDASYTESGIDKSSGSSETFNIQNSGAGTMELQVDGVAVKGFQTIAVSGQSNVVADAVADTLTLVAGSGITITTDAGADSITIAGGSSLEGFTTADNTGLGDNAGDSITTGINNTLIGINAGTAITDVNDITAIGHSALGALTSGIQNTAIGTRALESLVTGNSCTAVGRAALNSATGNNNTALGTGTGSSITSGSSNTFLGCFADSSSATGTNRTAIGANATITTDNSVQLGDTSVDTLSLSDALDIKIPNASPDGRRMELRLHDDIKGNKTLRQLVGWTKEVTDNTTTGMIVLSAEENSVQAGIIKYAVQVFDGTDLQLEEGQISYHLARKGTTYSNNTTLKYGNQQLATAGTLTVTWAIDVTTDPNEPVITINVNSSLTPSTGYPLVTMTIDNLTNLTLGLS